MELTGKIILDDDTMSALKEEIRTEVVEDIKKNGSYAKEAECYMSKCSYEKYMQIIQNTIDGVIERSETEKKSFSVQKKAYNQLLLIQQMLNI